MWNSNSSIKFILAVLLILTLHLFSQEYSKLWGKEGEKWFPRSRLPDFSYAGYHSGEKSIPELKVMSNVKNFGAVGDGVHDDTEAFLKAIFQTQGGAIFIPPGRYKITDIIEIKKSNVVLRGAGPEKTILFFPKYLNDIRPNWGATTEGRPTSNYSWSGGFLWIKGNYGSKILANVIEKAERGDRSLRVSSIKSLRIGQRVEIYQKDNPDNLLAYHLYSNDPGNVAKLLGRTHASLVFTIQKIQEDRIYFDRPLRFDVRLNWHPVIRSFNPKVVEVGIENLTFEFPVTNYQGHFTELGFNAIALSDVVNCWVKNVRIKNSDSGIFASGKFCTIQGVVFESERKPDKNRHSTGHHGIYISDDDNLFTDFDFRTRFIHDITVSKCSGNVISNGRGIDLCFDHHKRAPYENLFTNIDVGEGTRLWRCGGGRALGRNCAARGTFWNIRARKPQKYPEGFGPPSINLVGVQTDENSRIEIDGIWFENIPPQKLFPQNLHEAQLKKRLEK